MRNSLFRPAHRVRAAAAVSIATLVLGTAACGTDSADTSDTAADVTTAPATEAPASQTPTPTPTPAATTSAAPATTAASATLISLAKPADGATVTGSFSVSGKANSPEANVPWTLKNAAGAVAASGAFTAEGWMDKLYPFSGTVDLTGFPAGDYTFTVAVDDESDGEGSGEPEQVTVALHVA